MKKITTLILVLLTSLILTTSASAEFFRDAILTSPNAIWTDSRTFTNLSDAISAIGSNKQTLTICKSETLSSDLTIPENITLKFAKGSIITLGSYNLQIKGPLDINNVQVFNENGTGVVNFNDNSFIDIVYPEWWGAKADNITDCSAAIQSAVNSIPQSTGQVYASGKGGKISFGAGTYSIGTGIIVGENIYFVGQGPDATVIKATNNVIMFDFTGSDGEFDFGGIEDMTLVNYNGVATNFNIRVRDTDGCGSGTHKEYGHRFEHLQLQYGGICLYSIVGASIRDVRIANARGVGIYTYGNYIDVGTDCPLINLNIDHVDIINSTSYGIEFDTFNDSVVVSNTTAWYCGDTPFYLHNTSSYESWVTFIGCDALAKSGVDYCWRIEGGFRPRLISCHAEGQGLNTYGFYISRSLHGGSLIDCWSQGQDYPYYLEDVSNYTLNGCTSYGGKVAHFQLNSTDGQSHEDNKFFNCIAVRYAGEDEYGFRIVETSGTISRSRFENCVSYHIQNPSKMFALDADEERSVISCSDAKNDVYIDNILPMPITITGLSTYANNAAAIAGGLTPGAFYRNGADPDIVCVVH